MAIHNVVHSRSFFNERFLSSVLCLFHVIHFEDFQRIKESNSTIFIIMNNKYL